jgi:hypothetical protein
MAVLRSCVMLIAPLLAALVPSGGSAGSLVAEYAVSIRGFPVGTAKLHAELAGRDYSLAFSGGIRGLARLFSDARTTAHAAGRISGEQLQPGGYDHVWIEDGETETVAMRFAGRGVAAFSLTPPRERPERYVPLTEAQLANALDPLSAFLWPTPAAVALTPAICSRTLPLFDGKRRFDIDLSFARRDSYATRDGSFSGPAIVCSFRYTAVAGHRRGRTSDRFVTGSTGAEVWMASGGDGVAIPVELHLPARMGRIVLRATTLQVD